MAQGVKFKGMEIELPMEKIEGAVIDDVVSQLLHQESYTDEFGERVYGGKSKFSKIIKERIKEKIDESIYNIAAKHVLPEMETMIENFCIQETNEWGEKKKEPMTFVEYLVHRAEAYFSEPVDNQGKSKAEDTRGYHDWRKSTTRIAYLIDRHLDTSIQEAMKISLKQANESIVGGLEQAVKIALEEVQKKLSVTVKTK